MREIILLKYFSFILKKGENQYGKKYFWQNLYFYTNFLHGYPLFVIRYKDSDAF